MKKRIISIVAAAAMAATLLAGCGSSAASSAATASAAASTAADKTASSAASAAASTADAAVSAAAAASGSTRNLLIGLTTPTQANDFAVALISGLTKALEDKGCKVQYDSADGDVTKQVNQVENDITLGCNAIIVWPVNGDGISSTVQKAVAAGIPVLAFANDIPGASASNVAASDGEMGTAVAEMANDWINKTYADATDGSVKVLCITASNTPEAIQRSEGMQSLSTLNKKVNLITADVDWDSPDQSRQLVENQLLANPDINVILTPGNTVGIAANSYVMSASSPVSDKSKFAVFTVDETEEVTSAIKSSETNEAVLRGTVSMGSIDNTVNQLMKSMQPFIDGGDIANIKGEAIKVTPDTLK